MIISVLNFVHHKSLIQTFYTCFQLHNSLCTSVGDPAPLKRPGSQEQIIRVLTGSSTLWFGLTAPAPYIFFYWLQLPLKRQGSQDWLSNTGLYIQSTHPFKKKLFRIKCHLRFFAFSGGFFPSLGSLFPATWNFIIFRWLSFQQMCIFKIVYWNIKIFRNWKDF